jgi:hypothetical protein
MGRRDEKCEKLKEGDLLKILGVYGRIILKY